uniref:hypothetical protein n=1 Tax=uncultured Draconibacterium sp. TaxID=1573823 RepID=UPI0032163F49
MKTQVFTLIILILSAINVKGQELSVTEKMGQSIYEEAIETEIGRKIISDSIQYELRVWVSDIFTTDKVIQFTKDFDNKWNYRLGYFNQDYNSPRSFVFQDSIKRSIDWGEFEARLNCFINNKIPSHDEIELKYVASGKPYKGNIADFYSRDPASIVVEIYDNETHKVICYISPNSCIDGLINEGLSTKEHQDFMKFVNFILFDQIDYNRLRRIQAKEEENIKRKYERKYERK